MTPRKKHHGLPPNLTQDGETGRYRFRNPLNNKRKWFGMDREAAIKRAKITNKAIELERAKQVLAVTGAPTVGYVIRLYIEQIIPTKGWSQGTLTNKLASLNRYIDDFGNLLFSACDRSFLTDWIQNRGGKADAKNKHRQLLGDVWSFAISRNLTNINEPDMIYKASNSQRVKANQKTRKRLQIDEFWDIHDHPLTAPWLRRAMRIALITRQGRSEVCSLKYPRNGYFYVIRQKTAGDNDMAFMKFAVPPELDQIVAESREDGIVCPFVIHMRPLSMRPQHQKNKPHWAAVTPDYLTKHFGKARDAAGVGEHLQPRQRPTFHEIRSLGGRLLQQFGWSKEDIQEAYAHADDKVTELYLRDPSSIREEHYREVKIGLDLNLARQMKRGTDDRHD